MLNKICSTLHLSPNRTATLETIAKRYPFKITPYYLSLINPKDPKDPIGKMVIPTEDEFDPSGSEDPSEEKDNIVAQDFSINILKQHY